jgi:PPK2 family polyphosphate:nucleotide phosphotransferase
MSQPILVPPNTRVNLAAYDPDDHGGYKNKDDARKETQRYVERFAELQEVLWAEGKHALLVVFQALDAGGKDGVIEHVMHGVNPQGCHVTSFKVPTPEEMAHDYLWRIHKAAPQRGMIGIFNRSQYEDVLVVRVHSLVPETVWRPRYDQINVFEKVLADNGVTILKFFLYISKEEQKKRFQDRLSDPKKNWKFSLGDVKEREYWDDYIRAYEDALSLCSTPWAPWYIVPADNKWYRDLVVSRTIVETLEKLDLRFPPPLPDADKIVIP